ncbi:hypothetical protein V2J09_009777 [Rumex salicifolius]
MKIWRARLNSQEDQMTDHKSWLWRKKTSEKNLVVAEKQDPNDQEIQMLLAEKAELEKDLSDLNEKLSFALSECNSNDELAKKHAKTAQEALAGWEKAEAKAQSLKEELNEASGQRAASEERISQLEAALKECMQQLRFVREEKEQRIHDVLTKAANDHEEERLIHEEKQAEFSKKIAKLEAEISDLSEALYLKEEHVEELQRQRARKDADFKELLAKADALDKHNASLTYEVRVLEKELTIRNEENAFNRRTADATHRQHIENVKKIAKLEAECQRLRVLVRKRLPGPAALSKMRNEVQVLERGTTENRKMGNTQTQNANNLLVEKCYQLEEENNTLRETLQKKLNELQVSKNMYSRASARLSQAESQLDDSSRSQMNASMSDLGSDDKASCAGSWASALVSELEQFKQGKEKFTTTANSSKSNGVSSNMNLMDDFAEMEKLALVSQTAENMMENEMVPVSSCEPSLSVYISKVIKIIEGINLEPLEYACDSPMYKNLEAPAGNVVRVIQWKASEGNDVVQRFLDICCDLLHGKVDFVRFAQEVASTLEWIISHCFSVKDASSTKESLPPTNGYQGALPLLQIQSDLKEEIRKLKQEMTELESTKKEVEEKLTAMVDEQKPLMAQLQNQKQENEELSTQLSATTAKLEDAQKNLSSLEGELEKKTKHCEEMEATCLELQIQLDSLATKDVEASTKVDQDDKQLQTNWEIDAASEKLAKCQETIFNLGKQLKALAPPQENAHFDMAIASPTKRPTAITVTTPRENQRSSLLDKMLAEEDDMDESPKTKEIICTSEPLKPPPGFQKGSMNPAFASDQMRQSFRESGFGPLAIVPINKKQSNGGLLRKLLWRKRKNHSKKLALPFAASLI